MRKRIYLFMIMLLTVLCLSGCGRRGKVSDKNFAQALDIYQKYYDDLCRDTDECYIQLSLDAGGLPFIMTAGIEENSYNSESRIEIEILTIAKGEVVPLLNEKYSSSEFNTDYVVYSDGIIGILDKNEREWYQVRDGELNEVAHYDVNAGIVTFNMGKVDVDIDLMEENPLTYEKEYEKICKMLYGQTGPGTAYGKQVWLQELKGSERMEQPAFLQSPPVGWVADMFDSSDFRRMVSKLEQTGSMNNKEFLIWHYNYVVDNGWDDLGDFPSATGFIFRDPMMLNEIDEYMTYDKEWSQIYLLSFLNNTRDWKMAEKIDLFGELDEEELESWQVLWLLSQMEYALMDETWLYDVFLDRSEGYVIEYRDNGVIDPSDWFDSLLNELSQTYQMYGRSTEDILFMRHAIKMLQEEYDMQTDGKEGVEYIRTCVELSDNLPEMVETWEEGYIGSKQMEEDFVEYIKDKYVAFVEEGNSYIERENVEHAWDIGYVFVKMGEDEIPSLIRFYWQDWYYGSVLNTIDVLTYTNDGVKEYHCPCSQGIYWVNDVNGIYMRPALTMRAYYDCLWTLKDGEPYALEGKELGVYNAFEQGYFIFEGKIEFGNDFFVASNEVEISEQDYDAAMQEYADMTKVPAIIGPEQYDLSYFNEVEKQLIFGKTYTTIEEAFEVYLQNPDGGIEVIEVAGDGSSQGNEEVQNSGNGNSNQTNESSSVVAGVESAGESAVKPVLDIVVEDEVTQIKEWYNETQNNSDSYESFSALNGDITCYKGSELIRLDAVKGFNDWNYTRRYYFRNDSLYFAFVFNGSEEHRLYFKEDQLIRYIDENKNIYDYGDTDQFSEWSSPALDEAYQLYDEYVSF